MAQTERERMFEIAHALGHQEPTLWETARGDFFCSCSCGWESTNRRTPVDALGAGVHHALTIATAAAKQARTSGRPLSALVPFELRKIAAGEYQRAANDPRLNSRREHARQVA